jgi:sugar phosphate isomerase/epimerase
VGALRARGYTGPWSLETFNPTYWSAEPSEVASEGRRLLDELLDELLEPARD